MSRTLRLLEKETVVLVVVVVLVMEMVVVVAVVMEQSYQRFHLDHKECTYLQIQTLRIISLKRIQLMAVTWPESRKRIHNRITEGLGQLSLALRFSLALDY